MNPLRLNSQESRRAKTGLKAGKWPLFLLLVVVLGITEFGCSRKVFFTEDARRKLEEAGEDLSQLQFYNDKEILLRRKTVTHEILADEDGVVNNTEGLRVVDLRIRRGTPCRIDSVAGGRMYIRFEDGDGNTLCFYRNTYDHYQIYSDHWLSGRGTITYNLKEFVIERVGNDCLLMVQNNSSYKRVTDKKVVDGLRVNPYENEEEDEDDVEDEGANEDAQNKNPDN